MQSNFASQHSNEPRFLVIQYGARHAYSIPNAFAKTGSLAGVYTDFTATSRFGSLVSLAASRHRRLSAALSRRTPPSPIVQSTRTFDTAFLMGEVMRTAMPSLRGNAIATRASKFIIERQMAARGTARATHIYTMFGEGGRFVRQAKREGLGIVGDVYIALSADKIAAEEALRFPDWCDFLPNFTSTEEQVSRNSTLLTQSDLLVCPSEFVREDLINNYGVDIEKTALIPYGVVPRWMGVNTQPEPGRVFFAGTPNLRKGIHTLAASAARLRGRKCQFRVAGGVTTKVSRHPDASHLEFLGHLGLAEMSNELRQADVFAFPSLAEGSASATAEALAAGIPVVTTKAAGSVIRDGLDGFIVQERDPDGLAEAVWTIVSDRRLRARMSASARQRAASFSWDNFTKKVIDLVPKR